MYRRKFLVLAAFAALTASAQSASAQQYGREGYNFPARSPSMAAQFEFQSRQASSANSSSGSGSLGALNQYVTQYTSSSTSIANMNQVNQTATGGSTATLSQATDQASAGNQDAQASTKTKVDNSITKLIAPLVPAN